jgi:hypothetical protein
MFEEFYKKTFDFLFDKNKKKKLKDVVNQFDEKKEELFSYGGNDSLVQGDIISEIIFLNIIENGKTMKKNLNGMIISNSCDIEHDDNILIAPVYSFEEVATIYKGNDSFLNDLRRNNIFEKFYLPEFKEYKGFIADFSEVSSFSAKYLNDSFRNRKINRIASLSQIGWYFLMNKLALYLFRPESEDIIRS